MLYHLVTPHTLYGSICIHVFLHKVFPLCMCHCAKLENVCVYFTGLGFSLCWVVAKPHI